MAIREELLVKVIAAKLLPKSFILQEIKRRREVHSQQLSAYKEIEQEKFPALERLSYEDKCNYLTLRRGIRYKSEWIAWCNEAIAILSED